MKIVFFIQNLVPYHHARFERFASEFEGEVHVIQMTNKDTFASLEVEVQQSNYKLYSLFPNTEVESIKTKKLLSKLDVCLNEIHPNCICISGWGLRIGLVMLFHALKKHLPSIMLADSTEHDEIRVWWKELIKSALVKSSSAALVAGSPHQSYIESLGMKKNHTFQGYDVVDNAHFSRQAPQSSTNVIEQAKFPYFIACARFGQKKNIPRLIKAYASYKHECAKKGEKPYQLIIAGDGELREIIEQTIVETQVSDSVKLLGAVDYNSLPILYQNAEAFVHASTTEQWGLVVNEAMAAGAPVLISERCGCAPDLVHDGKNGFQFDPYDEKAITQSMLKFHMLSDDEKLSFREKSRVIIADWGPDLFANSLKEAITKAVEVGAKKNTLFIRILLKLLLRRAWQ